MHCESEFSETEDVQVSIIKALTYMLDIIYKEQDGNWLFKALSRRCFISPDYFYEVREILPWLL